MRLLIALSEHSKDLTVLVFEIIRNLQNDVPVNRFQLM